jgi:C4-type Zn-finger protein
MAVANAAAAAAQRAQQEAEAEADKLKTIVAKAEKGFIDLQDIAAALQPASVEESRFFGFVN